MPVAHLSDRAVIRVAGTDARAFLDRLVTCDLDRIGPSGSRFGALLTPQGKIIADFLIFDASADEPAFFFDVATTCANDLVRRLSMYKLRAKATVGDVSSAHAVIAGWGDAPAPFPAVAAATDPRLPALGWRAIVAREAEAQADTPDGAYHAHRIAAGVPEGGRDYAFGDAFPHEALMDQLAGVDFDKGCYVGQEVVSRMQHRGTARTRIVPLDYPAGEAPAPGSEVRAGERTLGNTGSAAGTRGLATIRIDRAADALVAGETIVAGGYEARLAKPSWIRFPYPGESVSPAA